MDELEIQGKKYISSKRASELTGYAKDYVGQLARGGKVAGTRVGRAWYVDEVSILAIAGSEHPTETYAELRIQHPENTLYSIHALNHSTNHDVFGTWGSLHYLEDADPLIPPLVNPAGSAIDLKKRNKTVIFQKTLHQPSVEYPQHRLVTISTDGVILPHRSPQIMAGSLSDYPRAQNQKGVIFLGTISFFMFITALALFGGSINPSHWVFSPATKLTASVADAGSGAPINSYFHELFTAGVDLIRSFLGLIFTSFWLFFSSRLIFLVHLLHLG